jgi:hypothetical protein
VYSMFYQLSILEVVIIGMEGNRHMVTREGFHREPPTYTKHTSVHESFNIACNLMPTLETHYLENHVFYH